MQYLCYYRFQPMYIKKHSNIADPNKICQSAGKGIIPYSKYRMRP